MSRYKFYRSHELITGCKFGCGHWRSVAPKALTEAEGERHGVQIWLWADVRVRVQEPLRNCLGSRSKSKKCDKLINPTVRVICRVIFKTVMK